MPDKNGNVDLWSFLLRYGVPLDAFGSAERGLRKVDASTFLNLLKAESRTPIGMEVWRRVDDEYRIDSLAGWYKSGKNANDICVDAENFVNSVGLATDDLLTVQF
ncbi:MAG: hypothetical protein JSR74_00755 [Proteobacteria bacterium]|nr:hypothetical protein [Pseudomonadota bacterium]